MKKLFSLLMLISLFTGAFAQERNSDAALSFVKKSESLTEATGWYKYNGKWTDNANMLDSYKRSSADGHQPNFSYMRIGVINTNGKNYHVLFYQFTDGAYKYPNIEEDWETNQECIAFIMDDKEYAQLKDAVEKKEGKDIKIVTSIDAANIYGAYEEQNFLRETIHAAANTSNISLYSMLINSQTLKGQDIVRFNLPGLHSSEDTLNESYFEVSAAEFKKLFID